MHDQFLTCVLWLLDEPWLEAESPRERESLMLPLLLASDGRGICHSCLEIWNRRTARELRKFVNQVIRFDILYYLNVNKYERIEHWYCNLRHRQCWLICARTKDWLVLYWVKIIFTYLLHISTKITLNLKHFVIIKNIRICLSD